MQAMLCCTEAKKHNDVHDESFDSSGNYSFDEDMVFLLPAAARSEINGKKATKKREEDCAYRNVSNDLCIFEDTHIVGGSHEGLEAFAKTSIAREDMSQLPPLLPPLSPIPPCRKLHQAGLRTPPSMTFPNREASLGAELTGLTLDDAGERDPLIFSSTSSRSDVPAAPRPIPKVVFVEQARISALKARRAERVAQKKEFERQYALVREGLLMLCSRDNASPDAIEDNLDIEVAHHIEIGTSDFQNVISI